MRKEWSARALKWGLGLMAPLALGACIETVPQADGSTRVRVGPGVAGRTAETPAPPGAPSASAGGAQTRSTAATRSARDGVDWTPMFKGMEDACDLTPQFEALRDQMIRTKESKEDIKRRVFTSRFDARQLPEPFRSAVGPRVQFKHEGDALSFDLPVLKGSYYNLPVRGVHVYHGLGNGIGGYALLLGVAPSVAKQQLRQVRFRKGEDAGCGEHVMHMTGQRVNGQPMTLMMCDYSC